MPSAPRRAALRRRLLAWYDAGHRALPWRYPQREADPYRVWLAEVMLQQTQVATALPYFDRFVARFPTLEALAAAREDEVLALWSGLGYYARGRNLLAAAREAIARHGGLPASLEALRALPGFGPYTAGAVASIAFAIPAAAVDGNVARVLARLFAVRGDPAAAPFRRRVQALAADLVLPGGAGGRRAARPSERASAEKGSAEKGSAERASAERASAERASAERASAEKASAEKAARTSAAGASSAGTSAAGARTRSGAASARPLDRPGDLNQALMELGATVCTPRSPRCARCPVAACCEARAVGTAERIPRPRRRAPRRRLVLACAVVRRDGLLLLARRPARGLFGGLWAPPCAEVPDGEDPRAALAGALRALGLRGEVGPEVATCERVLTHRALLLTAFDVAPRGAVGGREAVRWVAEPSLGTLGLPAAVRALLARIPQAPARAVC